MLYTPLNKPKTVREYKGKSLLEFPDEYIVLDLETTDFDYFFGEIIEIAAKKYINHELVDEFITLVKPREKIDPFITSLTRISNDMVSSSPTMQEIILDLIKFLGNSIIVAHNANFDINFLYDVSKELVNHKLENDFVDTLRLARWLIKDSKNHKLNTLAQYFDLETPTHRAESDVDVTHRLYLKLFDIFQKNPNSFEKKYRSSVTDFRKIVAETELHNIDKNNYFFNKEVCFTGKMTVFTKKEASQIVANLGATIQNNVLQTTDVLVLGDLEYQLERYGKKSSKHIKAQKMIENGKDIEIMTETTFLELINQ